MTKTIIVPLDGSQFAERALGPARTLARQTDASLVLLMSRLGGVPEPEAYLHSAAERAELASAQTVVIADMLAATAIPMVADTEPEPLLCMTTHGRSGPGLALFGSIAETVLRRINVPVVFVGPSALDTGDANFDHVVACLDGSELADAGVPVAFDLSRDLDADLWLIHVASSDWRLDVPSTVAADAIESAPLQRIAHALSGDEVKVSWETLHGSDPAGAIVEFAGTFPSPLIALTTHGRTGLSRLVTGSVTMSVVHTARCPVLVTRSRGTQL